MRYGQIVIGRDLAMSKNTIRYATLLALAPLAAMTLLTTACAATCAPDDASLDRAISQTLGAVRGNDANAFLAQLSDRGVAFGSDGDVVSYKDLSADFAGRTGRYCDLFSCNGQEGPLHHLFQMGEIGKALDTDHGLASVSIDANTNDELDLNYRFTADCRWEITGIGSVE